MKLNLIFCILPSSEDMIEKLHTNKKVGITDTFDQTCSLKQFF